MLKSLFEFHCKSKNRLCVFLLLAMIFLPSFSFAADKNKILYIMHRGDTTKAMELYQEYAAELGHHDHELLQQIALTLLDQGFSSKDQEIQVLTVFGAGISANEKTMYILENGIISDFPQLQLVSMNFLSAYHNDIADAAINKAMASDYLIIRIEALHQLAAKKFPTAVGQAECLMYKVSDELLPLFPKIFAEVGNAPATRMLRKLLTSQNEIVRIASIISAAEYNRDDLLPQIRQLATQHKTAQQEACAFALGVMKDEASAGKLETLSRSTNSSVRLAAFCALYQLGREEALEPIKKAAREKDVYAINLLADAPGAEDLLYQLSQNDSLQVRINASLALLERQDPRCLKGICEVLLRDGRDLAFSRTYSNGKALAAWKVITSAHQNLKDIPVALELSVRMREMTLTKALDLPEQHFLNLANTIFSTEQNELVPTLVTLLENLGTPAAIKLLKTYQQKLGAPLIRNYCNLALFRLKEPGPYQDNLWNWVSQQQQVELIRFRPLVPMDMRDGEENYQLTPGETSRLLVDSIETLAQSRQDVGISILLNIIQYGNEKNKYALAGLLMRATE